MLIDSSVSKGFQGIPRDSKGFQGLMLGGSGRSCNRSVLLWRLRWIAPAMPRIRQEETRRDWQQDWTCFSTFHNMFFNISQHFTTTCGFFTVSQGFHEETTSSDNINKRQIWQSRDDKWRHLTTNTNPKIDEVSASLNPSLVPFGKWLFFSIFQPSPLLKIRKIAKPCWATRQVHHWGARNQASIGWAVSSWLRTCCHPPAPAASNTSAASHPHRPTAIHVLHLPFSLDIFKHLQNEWHINSY